MNTKGFHLVDIAVVCCLITLFAALGVSNLSGMTEQYRLQAGCRSFVSALNDARVQALARNLPVEIRIHNDRQSYSLVPLREVPELWCHLPQGVHFSAFPAGRVTFFSRGVAAPGGSFTIGNSGGRVRVIVAPGGRVRWERLG